MRRRRRRSCSISEFDIKVNGIYLFKVRLRHVKYIHVCVYGFKEGIDTICVFKILKGYLIARRINICCRV